MMFKEKRSQERINAVIYIDGKEFNNVGIRFKGRSSYYNFAKRELKKLPFNVKSDFIEKHQVFEDDVRTLKLSNNFRDFSYIREMLTWSIAAQHIKTPRMSFAEVYVNDDYLGIYTMIESVDVEFVHPKGAKKDQVLVKCDPNFRATQSKECVQSHFSSLQYLGDNIACYLPYYELKSKKGWSDFILLCKSLNDKTELIDQELDVVSCLWMLALNQCLLNLDSYSGALCHNYYMAKYGDELFYPIMWDFNLSLGGFQFVQHDKKLNHSDFPYLDPMIIDENKPLISALLSHSSYRKIYLAMIKEIVESSLTESIYQRGEQFQKMIQDFVENENNAIVPFKIFVKSFEQNTKFGGYELPGIRPLIKDRVAFLRTLYHDLVAPEMNAIQIKKENQQLLISFEANHAIAAQIYIRRKNQSVFYPIPMTLNGQEWQMKIPNIEWFEYYVIVEGEQISIMNPSKAPQTYLTYQGDEKSE